MKTYLLTTPDLEELTNAQKLESLNDVSIRLYYVKDEIMLLDTVAKIKDMNITFIPISTSAEIIFDIGMFIGSMQATDSDIEIFCSEYVDVPENLMKTMNIKKLGKIAAKRQTRGKKDNNKPSQTKTVATEKPAAKNEETDKVAEKPKRTRKTVAKEPAAKEVKEEKSEKPVKATKESVPIKKEAGVKRTRKSGTKEPAAKTKATETKTTEEKVVETKPVPEVKDATKIEVTSFIKQMAVRGSDLNDDHYSDDALAQELVSIFKNENAVVANELLKMLNDAFSEDDAKVVYKWVKPNAKKLHELALTM